MTPNLSRRRFGTLMLGGVALPMIGGLPASAREIGTIGPVPAPRFGADGLPRRSPDTAGVSSQTVLDWLADVARQKIELHSFMLSRGGAVAAEGWWWPYLPQRRHMTHSLTKSVMVCGVGLALDEKRFGIDDRVVSFFPEHVPADASDNLKAMTVRDLLTMRCGHERETSGAAWRPIKTSWIAEFMKIPVTYRPGTKWVYTSAASYMLSAIVGKTVGMPLADYLRPRLFDPLGITDYEWEASPEGVTPGGNGLDWQTVASLKLGMLHARKGEWNGRRILSPEWVADATRNHVPGEDYGYQWWVGPNGAFYANGKFAQFSIVFPEHDAVLAVFSATNKANDLLASIWKHFPTAFAAPSPAATARLTTELRGLRVLPQPTKGATPAAKGGRFTLQANTQGASAVAFDFARGQVRYTLTDARGAHTIVAGLDRWIEQDTSMSGGALHHEYEPDHIRVVAGARWLDSTTLEMTWQFVESAFRDTVVCRFTGDGVTIDRSVNVNSKALSLPTLTGSARP